MTFPAYPEYKPSGFDWLPEVPAHWVDRKIARDIPFVVGWTPPSGKDEYYDGDLPWVTIADMTQMSVEDTKSKISHLAVRDKGAKVVPAGSMLFSFKLSVGKIAFLTIDSYTNEAIASFPPCGPLDLEYWKYAAPEFIPRYGRENIYGATLLNQELISSVRFFAPARSEQTQIARFLDHETARIDALIAEQQRLIELLKEKRQAVISHAVTKGLDPTVPMKDSGVEWLGEVPEHWQIAPLKYSARVVGRIGFRGYTTDDIVDEGDGALTLSPSNMVGGYMNFDKSTYISWDKYHQSPEIQLRQGDVVLVKTGSTYGRVAFVDHLPCETTINPQLAVFKEIKFESKFLFYLFESIYLKSLTKNSNTGGTMPTMTQENIGNYKIPMPGSAEMELILGFIETQVKLIEDLVSISENSVSLLNERRSALISAAVTGKIDVRGWQPPAINQAPKLEVTEAN